MSEGKVSPGQDFNPPPARIWNNMVDAGRAWADGQLNQNAGAPTRPRETDIIKIKNTSGALRRKGEILKIDGKAIEDITDENVWLVGKATTADCYFGILKRPVEISSVESLQVSGVCIALIDIIDADHTRADLVAGEYVLASSDSGPLEILYQPGTTGEHECVVRFAGSAGGGSETMWFSIQEVHCPNDYDVLENTLVVVPVWYTGGCGKTPPGGNGDGTWDVYDFCNYLSGHVFEELVGTSGRATYFYPYTSDPYDPPPCEPRWIISDLCAATECSGGT